MKRLNAPEKDDFFSSLFELEKRKTMQPLCPASGCLCNCCANARDPCIPELTLNQDLIEVRKRYRSNNTTSSRSSLCELIEMMKKDHQSMPNFKLLDTVTFVNGRPSSLVYFDEKLRCVNQLTTASVKSFLLSRKMSLDIEYLKKQYKKKNPDFFFILLDHQSEKLLKDFAKSLKDVHPSQRKICFVQVKHKEQPDVLNQIDFEALFEGKKVGSYYLEDVEYLQLFPGLTGEEEHERINKIYYFRDRHSQHPLYAVAEHHYSVWAQRNSTLEEQEQKLMKSMKSLQEYLLYVVFKLAVHMEYAYNCRPESFMLEFYRDRHQDISIRNIRYLNSVKKVGLYIKENQFSQQRTVPKQEYVELIDEMELNLKGFQDKYAEVFEGQINYMITELMDMKKSDDTFRQITGSAVDFHKIIRTKDVKYKKRRLTVK